MHIKHGLHNFIHTEIFGLILNLIWKRRVDWEFNLAVLSKFGFGEKFIGWIRECVETVTFSVLVNDGPTKIFEPKRGLR